MTLVQPELRMVSVPLASLHPNPWNPNKQDERTYKAERESLRANGFIDPVTARQHPTNAKGKLVPYAAKAKGWSLDQYQIIDGEHRSRAAADEGFTEGLVISLGELDDASAQKLTLIFNETQGEADVALMGKLLGSLQSHYGNIDDLLLGLPFTKGELDNLIKLGAVDWDDFNQNQVNPPAPSPDASGMAKVSFEVLVAQVERINNFALMLQREWELERPGDAVERALEAAAKAL